MNNKRKMKKKIKKPKEPEEKKKKDKMVFRWSGKRRQGSPGAS
jgi:hypothetical protein